MSALSKALSPAVREIRLFGCQKSTSSEGLRKFIAASYPSIKKANPTLPILVRQVQGSPARVFVRLDKGTEKSAILENLEPSQIEQKILSLVN